jgi:hypothetical protein
MSVFSVHPLSALTPVEFVYKFNKEEKLSKNTYTFANKFRYCVHNITENARDAVFSKNTFLVLTDNLHLSAAFETDSKQLDINEISGSFFLKTPKGKRLSAYKGTMYIGGMGENVLFTLNKIGNNIVELVYDKDYKVTLDEDYPFVARLSKDLLADSQLNRRRFEMDYRDGKVCFKANTKNGQRFLSFGADQVVKAVGVTLNSIVISPYVFDVEFVTSNLVKYDFDAKVSEIKYFNEITGYANQTNVKIKESKENNTHLLLSCPTAVMSMSSIAPINIALTKTNFSSSGTYLIKQTT